MRACFLFVLLCCVACAQEPVMENSGDISYGRDLRQYPISADPSTVSDVPPDAREAEIRKAFEGIIARLPESQREGARQELQRGFVGRPISSHDPEIARLWSRVLSLTEASLRSKSRTAPREVSTGPSVRVALVQKLKDSTFRAMVVRRPDDGGIPTLLLPETSATGEDLLRGLQAARRTTARYKPTPGRESIVAVRHGAKRKEPSDRMKATFAPWEETLARLRQVATTDLKGYGSARVTMMIAPAR